MASTSGRQSGSADSDTPYQTLPLSSTPEDFEMMPPPSVPRALTSKCRRTSDENMTLSTTSSVCIVEKMWNLSGLVKLSLKGFYSALLHYLYWRQLYFWDQSLCLVPGTPENFFVRWFTMSVHSQWLRWWSIVCWWCTVTILFFFFNNYMIWMLAWEMHICKSLICRIQIRITLSCLVIVKVFKT